MDAAPRIDSDSVTISRVEYDALLSDRARVQALEAALAKLQQQILTLTRLRFGATSESADQLSLFGSADVEIIEQTVPPQAPVAPRKPGTERQRLVLPKDLPEERVEIDLPESDKLAADGTPLTRIGEEVTVKLGFRPAVFFKKLIIRPKYADPRAAEAGVRSAPLPAQLIDGSYLDASLAAHLVVSKYADHLPLFRVEQIYRRGGIAIPRSTLSDWVLAIADWLDPLVQRLRWHLLQQGVIHTDETVLPLQSVGRTIKARAWAYVGRDPKLVLYDFTVDKAGEHVRRYLAGWEGYLQADAASNYDALYRLHPGVVEVGCWAHARRKFFEIAVAAEKSGQRVLAHEAVELIADLFEIERQAKDLGDHERTELRQREAVPKLQLIKDWCEHNVLKVLPKSPTSGAVAYLLKHWTALNRYTEDGRIAIDNNAAERALRKIAVGRKNWLFAGSEKGGRACAICTSLIETAKAHGHNPLAYLTDVLTRLPTTLNQDIDSLLPMNWIAS